MKKDREILFLKEFKKELKKMKPVRLPYIEGNFKQVLFRLEEADWDIPEKLLKRLKEE